MHRPGRAPNGESIQDEGTTARRPSSSDHQRCDRSFVVTRQHLEHSFLQLVLRLDHSYRFTLFLFQLQSPMTCQRSQQEMRRRCKIQFLQTCSHGESVDLQKRVPIAALVRLFCDEIGKVLELVGPVGNPSRGLDAFSTMLGTLHCTCGGAPRRAHQATSNRWEDGAKSTARTRQQVVRSFWYVRAENTKSKRDESDWRGRTRRERVGTPRNTEKESECWKRSGNTATWISRQLSSDHSVWKNFPRTKLHLRPRAHQAISVCGVLSIKRARKLQLLGEVRLAPDSFGLEHAGGEVMQSPAQFQSNLEAVKRARRQDG